MKYTYKISTHANSEIFAKLKNDIKEFYPDFKFEKEIKDADGSCTDFFRCEETGENIAAELSYANNNIILTGDVRMPELADKYKLAKAEPNEKETWRIGFNIKDIFHALFCTPFGIKLFAVPLALFVLAAVFNGIYNTFVGLWAAAIGIALSVMFCGGLMLIPTVILSASLAEKDKDLLYKIPLSAFLLFAELHLLIFYLNQYDGIDLDDIAFFGIYLLRTLAVVLLILYLFFLPIIISDEGLARRHKRYCGKRAKGWQSAVWWSGTAAVMLTVMIAFVFVSSATYRAEQEDIAAKESARTRTAVEPLIDKHGAAMRTVYDYALVNDYYDWYNCPDESVKDEWQELFLDDSEYVFGYEMEVYFDVYIKNGEGKGRYRIYYDGESFNVNGETFEGKAEFAV